MANSRIRKTCGQGLNLVSVTLSGKIKEKRKKEMEKVGKFYEVFNKLTREKIAVFNNLGLCKRYADYLADSESIFTFVSDGSNGLRFYETSPQNDILKADFSVRTHNCLKRAGVDTIDALLNLRLVELFKIRGLGSRQIQEIIVFLEDNRDKWTSTIIKNDGSIFYAGDFNFEIKHSF